jgi:hypothetical protein
LQPHFHEHWSHIQVDRGSPPFWNIRAGMCTSFNFFLDNLFWSAQNNHFWSWAAIYIKFLVTAFRYVTHNASPNNCLSPWVERCSWKTSPPPQGCATCMHHYDHFGRGDPLGTPRPPCTAEGRNWSFPSRAPFGAPIVLPNEFLKGDEIPVDPISKNFVKSLDAPAFFLPRHN